MKIRVARLISGSETPAGDGVTGALRCVVELEGGEKRAAVLKRGPIEQIAAEAFCGLLLRAWGLPVPEPMLIEEAGSVSFASLDVGYPNLKQRLGISPHLSGAAAEAMAQIACHLACSFKSAPLAAACDEAIDNRDRNLGNILWDGSDEAWIDHAFSVGVGSHFPDQNKLCMMAAGGQYEEQLRRGAVAHALILDRAQPSEAGIALEDAHIDGSGIAAVVATRLSSLAARLLARFPVADDLLSGMNQFGGQHD